MLQLIGARLDDFWSTIVGYSRDRFPLPPGLDCLDLPRAHAVGIVLGAGPLQGQIGDTLTAEITQLRSDKASLHTGDRPGTDNR